MEISPEVRALGDEVKKIRRELHRIPETALCEFKTSAYIKEYLKAAGADDIREFYGTGVRAVIKGGYGPAIAFRADMDALSIKEETGAEYASAHEGMMHACGHDGHMAIALATAKLCAQNRSKLSSDAVFVFQPAEEGVGGAEKMVKEGLFDGLDIGAIYGYHIMPGVPVGKIGVHAGPLMARTTEFNVCFRGKSAHAAKPHEGLDALAAAAFFVVEAKKMTQKDPALSGTILSFGKFNAGTARNIIAAKAHVEGITRSFTEEENNRLRKVLDDAIELAEKETGAKGNFNQSAYYPAVVNPPELAERVAKLLGDAAVDVPPQMTAEDFSYFQQVVPGLYMFLGAGDVPGLHNSKFDFDEIILLYAIEANKRILGI